MDKPIVEDEDFKIWWLLSQTRHLLMRGRNKELAKYDITTTQAAILFIINTLGENATPAMLSRLMLRGTNTISANLNVMVRRGLVEKKKDMDKKNQVRITITQKGWDVYTESTKRDFIHYTMAGLSNEERKYFRKSLEILRDKSIEWLMQDREPITPYNI